MKRFIFLDTKTFMSTFTQYETVHFPGHKNVCRRLSQGDGEVKVGVSVCHIVVTFKVQDDQLYNLADFSIEILAWLSILIN